MDAGTLARRLTHPKTLGLFALLVAGYVAAIFSSAGLTIRQTLRGA